MDLHEAAGSYSGWPLRTLSGDYNSLSLPWSRWQAFVKFFVAGIAMLSGYVAESLLQQN